MVGAVVADNAARSYASEQIATKVRASLALPASTPVDVTVAGTSVLWQLLSGKLDRIDVGVARLALGALTGSAELSAEGIPIEAGKKIDRTEIVFTTDEKALSTLFASTPGLTGGTVAVSDGSVEFGTNVTLFGFALPVGISFTPSASKGQLELDPSLDLAQRADVHRQTTRSVRLRRPHGFPLRQAHGVRRLRPAEGLRARPGHCVGEADRARRLGGEGGARLEAHGQPGKLPGVLNPPGRSAVRRAAVPASNKI